MIIEIILLYIFYALKTHPRRHLKQMHFLIPVFVLNILCKSFTLSFVFADKQASFDDSESRKRKKRQYSMNAVLVRRYFLPYCFVWQFLVKVPFNKSCLSLFWRSRNNEAMEIKAVQVIFPDVVVWYWSSLSGLFDVNFTSAWDCLLSKYF